MTTTTISNHKREGQVDRVQHKREGTGARDGEGSMVDVRTVLIRAWLVVGGQRLTKDR